MIDGLGESALFTVGDAESPDCCWPAEPGDSNRAGRRRPGGGRGRGVSLGADETAVARRRRFDFRSFFLDFGRARTPGTPRTRGTARRSRNSTATGSFSPWANDNAAAAPAGRKTRRRSASSAARAAVRATVAGEPGAAGGWSETGGAAALVAGGELRVKDCVVEGHRTGSPPAAAAPAQPGRPLDPRSVFRENAARRGRTARTPSRRIGSPRTRAITCTTSTRDRCRWTGARGSMAGRGASTPRPRRRAREGERSRRSVIRGAERTIGVYFTTRLPKSVI